MDRITNTHVYFWGSEFSNWYECPFKYKNQNELLFNQLSKIESFAAETIAELRDTIWAMDMLNFDYTQPIAQNESFKVEFKYSNFDFEFITDEDDT